MNLLLSRRALGCAIATLVVERVFAVPAGVGELPAIPMLPDEPLPSSGQEIENALSSGVARPLDKEETIAKRVLDNAPRTVNPYEVAQYFNRVGLGIERPLGEDLGEDWTLYVREWPVRLNPVILHFFTAVPGARPKGDCTAWCSAFVNWCIERGRVGRSDAENLVPNTRSAAALSFQDWGKKTSNPKPGDIVVFQSRDPGHGHVGFFSSQDNEFVTVLGGNQGGRGGLDPSKSTCSDPSSVGGRVMEQKIRKKGGYLELLSFRTDASLHDMSSRSKPDKPSQSPGANQAQTPPGANQAQTPDKPKPNQQATSAARTAAEKTLVEIELLNGRKLRVNANIDSDILARLIAALDR